MGSNAPYRCDVPIRCPECHATLGELRNGVVVVELRVGHGSRILRTIRGAMEIECGRNRKEGPCPGIWRAVLS